MTGHWKQEQKNREETFNDIYNWTRGQGGSGRGKNENLKNENIKPLNLKNMKR